MKKLLRELNEIADGPGKVYAKVQGKLRKLGVEASIDAIRDFFSKDQTPRCKKLIKEMERLSYDPSKGWIGNEGFFKELGISREEFMDVAKALGEMVYEQPLTEEAKFHVVNKKTIVIDGRKLSKDIIRTVANKHFFGTTNPTEEDNSKAGHGYFLRGNLVNYYEIKSVRDGIVVASLDKLGPEETKPIAKKYLDTLTEDHKCPVTGKMIKGENEEENVKMVICPLCKKDVAEEDIEDHMEEHETKHPVRKMKRSDESETGDQQGKYEINDFVNRLKKTFNIDTSYQTVDSLISGSDTAASIRLLKRLERFGYKSDGDSISNHEFFQKLGMDKNKVEALVSAVIESVIIEARPALTSLTAEQKKRLVDFIENQIGAPYVDKKDRQAAEGVALDALDDVAGFETAPKSTINKVVKELVDMYMERG